MADEIIETQSENDPNTAIAGFLFTDLAGTTQGKWFDGIAPGSFIDMYLSPVRIKTDELDTYVKNTKAAIDATRTESGELVGLPIDSSGHDKKGFAAGWITDAKREGNVVRFLATWTALGVDLISGGLQRMFSPTLDLHSKTALGGSLTNWPATRSKDGKVLLRPIELSAGMFGAMPDADYDRSMAMQYACRECSDTCVECAQLCARCPNADDAHAACVAACEKCTVACEACATASMKYGLSDPRTQEAMEICLSACRECITACQAVDCEACGATCQACAQKCTTCAQCCQMNGAELSVVNGGGAPADQLPEGDNVMTVKLQDLTPEDRADLVKQVAAEMGKAQTPPVADLSSLFDLEGLSEEAKKQRKEELKAQLVAIRKQAELEYKAELARLQHESSMTELAQKLTGGNDDSPRGYRVSAEELRSHLLKLDPDEAKFWGELMTRTAKDGFVEFAEMGHGRRVTGAVELPAEIAKKLDSGEMKIADLSSPILDLGDVAQYNLSKWQGKEK